MKKKTREQLRADAAHLRQLAAESLVHAERLEREAEAARDEPRELVMWWLECCRRLKAAH